MRGIESVGIQSHQAIAAFDIDEKLKSPGNCLEAAGMAAGRVSAHCLYLYSTLPLYGWKSHKITEQSLNKIKNIQNFQAASKLPACKTSSVS